MITRFLDKNDIALLEDFFKLVHLDKDDSDHDRQTDLEFYKQSLTDPNIFNGYSTVKLIALEDSGKISSFKHMIIRNYEPSWVSGGFRVLNRSSFFNCRTNGMSDLMTFAVNYAEKQGYYNYEWYQKLGKNYSNRFNRMQNQIEILQRYHHFDIGVIPANADSIFSKYKTLVRRKKPFDLLVKGAVLKNEFRKPITL